MKYIDLTALIKTPIFSKTDLLMLHQRIFDYQFSVWVKKGYLLKLKNGLYVFSREADKLRGEEIAFRLYNPSYLSLESALSLYGFIPEIVYAYVSVTTKINRTFDNSMGHFIYRHIKKGLFWGYRDIKTEFGQYLIAEPEKALLDYIYLNLPKIRNEADFENIRLNHELLREKLDAKKFWKYFSAFGVKKMERWAIKCLQ